jgi:hypothetical protein
MSTLQQRQEGLEGAWAGLQNRRPPPPPRRIPVSGG